jgi:hypothetical protein
MDKRVVVRVWMGGQTLIAQNVVVLKEDEHTVDVDLIPIEASKVRIYNPDENKLGRNSCQEKE